MSEFSTWLTELMSLRGDSQRKVAAYAGISPSTVHNWLTGKSNPSYENCVKLAEYFRLSAKGVLAKAGYLTREDSPDIDVMDPDLTMLFNGVENLDAEAIEELKGFVRYVAQRQKEREEKKKSRKRD